jgi:hypothetical protein
MQRCQAQGEMREAFLPDEASDIARRRRVERVEEPRFQGLRLYHLIDAIDLPPRSDDLGVVRHENEASSTASVPPWLLVSRPAVLLAWSTKVGRQIRSRIIDGSGAP